MRKVKRITKITVETERVLIVRSRERMAAWCAGCGAQVPMVTMGEAAMAAGVSELMICHQIEAHSLHYTQTPDGRVAICLNSLCRSVRSTVTQ